MLIQTVGNSAGKCLGKIFFDEETIERFDAKCKISF